MKHVEGVIAAAAVVQQQLSDGEFRFCFIGGIALLRWGEPRYTQDVDLTLLCPFGSEREFASRLSPLIPPRIEDAIAFSERARIYLGQTANGTPVDVAFGGIDFEHRCVERSFLFQVADSVVLRTCSAEDLVVMKAFADRERDWADIDGVMARQGQKLDWHIIESELKQLLELRGGPKVWKRLQILRERYIDR